MTLPGGIASRLRLLEHRRTVRDQVDPLTLDFVLPRSGGVTLFQASMVLLMQLHSPVEDDVQADQNRILQTLADVRRTLRSPFRARTR